MPSTITAVPIWRPIVQEPNNGENADKASLQLFTDELTDRTEYLYEHHHRGNFQLEKYGAVGSGVVNDYPSLIAARDAAVAAGGGTLWATPGKSYRLDSELELDGRVALRTMKGYNGSQDTRLIRNHAGRLIKVNGSSPTAKTPTIIEGFKLIDAAANAQAMVDNQNGSLTLLRCWLQGINGITGGPLVLSRGGEGETLRLRECWIAPDTGGGGIEHTIGLLDVSGNTFAFPSTHSNAMIYVNSTSSFDLAIATIIGNDFWAKSTTAGDPLAIALDGLAWKAVILGNHFRGAAATELDAIAWGAGGARQLNVGPNTYEQARRYVPPAGVALFGDSALDLGTWRDSTSGTTYVLPDGYGNMVLVGDNSGGCAIQLPKGLFEGQLLTFTYVNDRATPAVVSFVTTPLTASPTVPSGGPLQPGAGQTLTGTFVWEKAFGSGVYATGRWIQKGTWGVGTTLVA